MRHLRLLMALALALALLSPARAGDRNLYLRKFNDAQAADEGVGFPIWPAGSQSLADALSLRDFEYVTTAIAAAGTATSRPIPVAGSTGDISIWFQLTGDGTPDVDLGVLVGPDSTSTSGRFVVPEIGGMVAQTITNENLHQYQISIPIAEFIQISVTNEDSATVTVTVSKVLVQ